MLRRHMSYANVVATLALFLAMSGGAAYKRREAARSAPKGYAAYA